MPRKILDHKKHIKSKITINKKNQCWEFNGILDKIGYGKCNISLTKNKKFYLFHRYVFYIYNGEFDAGLKICHKCDNPRCCNPRHLFSGTQKDNSQDALNKGRLKFQTSPLFYRGENNKTSKYKDNEVILIKYLHKNGFRNSIISKIMKINKHFISKVISGKTWNHINV